MPNGYQNAGESLGSMIFGGAQTPGTYQKAQKNAYGIEEALQDARRARSQAIIEAGRQTAREAITADLLQRAQQGDLGAQAQLGASVLNSNQTINMDQLGDYARPHYGEYANEANEAYKLGDYAKANAAQDMMMARDVEPVRVLGGAYTPSGMAAMVRANKPAASRGRGATDAPTAGRGKLLLDAADYVKRNPGKKEQVRADLRDEKIPENLIRQALGD